MPYINVNDAYILDNTGKQVDDAVDYALANSNRNLLDNPWFTVNQRNFTSSTGVNNIYCVDRWYIARGTGTISKTNNGITINGVGASRETTFQQMIDCGDLTGRTVALSVNDGGTIRQITRTVPARTTSNNIFIRFTLRDGVSAFLYAMATSSAYAYMLQFQVNAGYTIDLRAVKLELGSYSTLANDVPPDYGEELRKCQRYFWRLGNATYLTACIALAESATQAFGDVILPVPMRAQPSVQPNGTFLCYTGAQSITITSLTGNASSYPTVNPNRVALRATVASGLTIGTFYNIQSRGNAAAYIDFSADL